MVQALEIWAISKEEFKEELTIIQCPPQEWEGVTMLLTHNWEGIFNYF